MRMNPFLVNFSAEACNLFILLFIFWLQWIRWNSWNHFHCNITEEVIRETGIDFFLNQCCPWMIWTKPWTFFLSELKSWAHFFFSVTILNNTFNIYYWLAPSLKEEILYNYRWDYFDEVWHAIFVGFLCAADALEYTGLAKLGYQYVNIGVFLSLKTFYICIDFVFMMVLLYKYLVNKFSFQMIAGESTTETLR